MSLLRGPWWATEAHGSHGPALPLIAGAFCVGACRKLHHPIPIPVEGVRIAPLLYGNLLEKAHYQLMVLHEGEIAGGRYWALGRRSGGWCRFDDTVISYLGN